MILSPRGNFRRVRWETSGEAELPYTTCLRCDIIEATWELWTIPAEVIAAFKAEDPGFEIIFDPLCREPGTNGPAFFLYKKTIDRCGPMDAIELELPCQVDCDYAWGYSTPAIPDMRFFEAWKARDNARLPGTPEEIDRQRMREKYERACAVMAQKEAERMEPFYAIDEELAPYVVNRRTLQHNTGKYRRDSEARPGRKVYGQFG